MKTFRAAATLATNASSRTVMHSLLRRSSITKTPIRHFVHSTVANFKLKTNTPVKEMIFSATPKPEESCREFKERVHETVIKSVFAKAHADSVFMMFSPTRVAKSHEKIANANHHVGLPLVDRPVLTGHCLASYINKQGQSCNDYTVSMRPDLNQSPMYKAKAAPDTRLPDALMQQVSVWPAKHTTVSEEVRRWADDAFYVHHVHKSRPGYPLHCLFKTLTAEEKARYIAAVNDVKLSHLRYSLLDHFHPHTGVVDEQVVPGQNCTVVAKLAGKMSDISIEDVLGDNPTPQVVKAICKKYYFGVDKTEHDGEELDKVYKRVCA